MAPSKPIPELAEEEKPFKFDRAAAKRQAFSEAFMGALKPGAIVGGIVGAGATMLGGWVAFGLGTKALALGATAAGALLAVPVIGGLVAAGAIASHMMGMWSFSGVASSALGMAGTALSGALMYGAIATGACALIGGLGWALFKAATTDLDKEVDKKQELAERKVRVARLEKKREIMKERTEELAAMRAEIEMEREAVALGLRPAIPGMSDVDTTALTSPMTPSIPVAAGKAPARSPGGMGGGAA